MTDASPSRALYLESLAGLHRAWAHEARAHLGNVALQLDLLSELLARGSDPGAPDERLAAPVRRARQGAARLERWLEVCLGAAAPLASRAVAPGLAGLLAEVAEMVEPAARERRVVLEVGADSGAGAGARADEPVREALALVAIGLVAESEGGTTLDVGLAPDGEGAVVSFRGAEPAAGSRWLAAARAALEGAGGRVTARAGGIDLAIPAAPERR